MQVQIKQNEIVQAIRAFISNQGISLVGKDVKIDFTAGRKNGGLIADISIEDAVLNTAPITENTSVQMELPLDTIAKEVAVEVDPGYSTTAPSTPSLFN